MPSTQDLTRIDDTRIGAVRPLITPALLQEALPVSEQVLADVEHHRHAISDVLHGRGDRLVWWWAHAPSMPMIRPWTTRSVSSPWPKNWVTS